ncbi:MAG: gluconate 2-dehydrogenase subunit 3 family protein, partial [Gemmatimonadales bacterium]
MSESIRREGGKAGSLTRREALATMAATATAFAMTTKDVEAAVRSARAARAGGGFQPTWFTSHEWESIRVLVDLIIPRDGRSGSATDAGVPEFMDFLLAERNDGGVAMRGGLGWLDDESQERFGGRFIATTEAQRRQILDDIAFPGRARPEMSHGVAFFTMVRDFTASGFWSSQLGVEDLQFMGNTAYEWNGCPP